MGRAPEVVMSPLLRRSIPLSVALGLVVAFAGIALGHADVGAGRTAPTTVAHESSRHDGDDGAGDRLSRACHYRYTPPAHRRPPPGRHWPRPHPGTSAVVVVTGHLSAEGWVPPPGATCPPTP